MEILLQEFSQPKETYLTSFLSHSLFRHFVILILNYILIEGHLTIETKIFLRELTIFLLPSFPYCIASSQASSMTLCPALCPLVSRSLNVSDQLFITHHECRGSASQAMLSPAIPPKTPGSSTKKPPLIQPAFSFVFSAKSDFIAVKLYRAKTAWRLNSRNRSMSSVLFMKLN